MNEVSVQWIDGNAFSTLTGSGHTIVLDSKPEEGETSAGPAPMEMLLVGLAGCTAVDVVHILRRQRQPMTGLQVTVKGERADDYPMVYTNITIEYVVQGEVDEEKLQRAIALSEEKYCSASAMLGKTAHIEHTYRLEED
jgi:putative redox protein